MQTGETPKTDLVCVCGFGFVFAPLVVLVLSRACQAKHKA